MRLQSYKRSGTLYDTENFNLTAGTNGYYSDYLRLILPYDEETLTNQTLKADLLGTVKITWDSIMGNQNVSVPVMRTNDARIVRLNVTIFSQGGVYPDGVSLATASNQVQKYIDHANLIYAQAGVAFRATIKSHNMPTNNGITLSNSIPCGYWMGGEGDFKKTNMIMDVTTQNWQMPDELVTFKTYVTNSANGILSSDPNDIEVLVALTHLGFSYMQTNGTNWVEMPDHPILANAYTPQYANIPTNFVDITMDTHCVVMPIQPEDPYWSFHTQRVLAHELLHVLSWEIHTDGGVDDATMREKNLMSTGYPLTTASYLSVMNYSVSTSYENQEEKVRASTLLRTWEE